MALRKRRNLWSGWTYSLSFEDNESFGIMRNQSFDIFTFLLLFYKKNIVQSLQSLHCFCQLPLIKNKPQSLHCFCVSCVLSFSIFWFDKVWQKKKFHFLIFIPAHYVLCVCCLLIIFSYRFYFFFEVMVEYEYSRNFK